MKKMLFVIALLVASTHVVQSQDPALCDSTRTAFSTHYFGISTGFTTGVGFSYIYWPGRSGYQVTCLPLIDKKSSYISLGLTYLLTLKQMQKARVFLFVGNHVTNYFDDDDDFYYNGGVGPGIQLGNDYLKFNFMVGYGLYTVTTNIRTRPTVETGLFFNF